MVLGVRKTHAGYACYYAGGQTTEVPLHKTQTAVDVKSTLGGHGGYFVTTVHFMFVVGLFCDTHVFFLAGRSPTLSLMCLRGHNKKE